MKKRMVFGLALVCMALLTACAREPVQEKVEPTVPEETPEMIVTSVPEEGEETEKRSIDPGFTAPAPAGTGDGGMAVPAPDWDPDPDFDVSSDADQGEIGSFVVVPEPVE